MALWKNTWKKQLVCQTLCFSLLVQTGMAAAGGVPAPRKPREWVEGSRLAAVSASAPAPSMTSAAPEAAQPQSLSPRPRTAPAPSQDSPEKVSYPPSVLTDSAGRHGAAPSLPTAASPEPAEESTEAGSAPDRGDDLPPFPPGMDGATLSRSLAASSASAPLAAVTAATTAGLTASSLAAGWNLSSVPSEPVDRSPAAVFSSIAGKFTRVFAYDACTPGDPWKLYDPADAAASDLTVVDQKIGFWIEMTAPAAVPEPGSPAASTTIHLCPGWNLIGFPSEQARPVRTALASIEGKYTRVFGYDPTDAADPWELYDVATPAWANDLALMQPGRGYWVFATAETDLTISNNVAEPDLAITAPADLAVVTAPTEVRGTVTSDLLQSWTLSYRAHGEAQSTVFASGTTPVVNGPLGTLDPTLLLNGGYAVELTATDLNGESTTIAIDVNVEGLMKVGNFTLSFLDLEIPLSGLPIQVYRNYDSRDKRRGDFGVGWTLALKQGSYKNNRKPGQGWQILSGTLPCRAVQETLSHITTIRISDREVYRFRLRLASPAATLGGCFAQARFDFVDGPIPGATLAILGNTEVIYQNATSYVVDSGSFDIYEPQDVRLTTRDGRSFDLDLQQGVTRLQDLSGNTLSITPGGVTHSSGLSVAFQRDGLGRISSITDPEGESVTYEYDAAGDLTAVTDRESNTSRFTYAANHHLLEIEDPLGRQPVRNEYDASGRLIRTTDGSGKTIEFDHQIGDRQEIVTDRLGHSRVLEYDARGNVVREVDALGNETLRTFDARDNLLTERDPLGNVTTYTYTPGNDLATQTDPLGNVTSYTYDAAGRVLTRTDPRGKVTANRYDGNGNLLEVTDPAGAKTSFTYDARGNRLTETDALGKTTTFTYDTAGNLTRQVDALGRETAYTYNRNGNRLTETATRTLADGSQETLTTTFRYDSVGRLVETVQPGGASARTVFDAIGQVKETFDELNRRTAFTFDDLGRQTAVAYPDGTSETRTYDAEGRPLTATDRAGRVTTYLYDAVGRLTGSAAPDGTSTSIAYDAAGRLVAATDANGHTTTYVYDAAGRRTRVVDPLGGQTDHSYDPAGRQVAITDPNRHTTQLVYDDAGRLVRTIFPDATEEQTEYDALGQRVAETDPAGRTTRFGYDALGRLTTVTDALNQVTSYAYDEVGNRISQTDANGHTTRFGYDALGRMVRRELPDGAAESLAYDAAGNLTSRTDLAGRTVTFAYDLANRLTQKTYPGGGSVSFTYTATGRRATAVDARGTTIYAYDGRDRLTDLTYPDGRKLTYGYDGAGNRTSLAAHVAGQVLTTSFSCDAAGRLDKVTDPQGRLYDHGYDANGNRTSVAYPNGVQTVYSHNPLNRLTELRTQTNVGAVVQSHVYTLGPAGNRTRVTEADGTVRAYGYDALYRLTGETVTRNETAVYAKTFAYDPVGNRLQQVHTDAAGTVTTFNATFDTRNRQLTRGAQAWTWDANGNLAAKSNEATYGWDFDGRLDQVTLADGTAVTHTYDADGVRVKTETRKPDGTTTVVEYLVDTSGPLSHVVAETSSGALAAYYVRGDDLLAVMRPGQAAGTWTSRFFHADGLGSIRVLTDETGGVTDRYAFSAFGELLSHEGQDPNAYLFAGEPLDPNAGFYYLRARWMDPAAGRLASLDPHNGSEFDPASLHKYLYARNAPTVFVDPTGRDFSLPSFSVSAAIQGGLISVAIAAPFRILSAAQKVRAGADLGAVSQEVALGLAKDFAVGFVLAGVLQYIPRLFALRSAGQAVQRASNSVWNLNRFERGRRIEELILGGPARTPNAPVVEEVVEGVATSIKSIDLTRATYQSTSALKSLVSRYARDLAQFTFNIGPYRAADVSQRVLVIAIEEGAATAAQASTLQAFIRNAQYLWPEIKVLIVSIP